MNFIREKRKALNLSQREFSKRINISYQVFQKYENGTVIPSVLTALKIAKALNTTVEELFPEEDHNS